MDFPIVLVRFSEIALKSKHTRTSLRRLLRHNILTDLKINAVQFERIEDTWERLIVYTNESERVADRVSKVFGVASASPAVECASKIETISGIVSGIAEEKLNPEESFAIRVRRVGEHEFTTNEVAARCGSAVIEALRKNGAHAKVDLESPNHEFFVEVRGERSFIYCNIKRGVGGLPLGSQGNVVSHLCDVESILATWLMMKRGCSPIFVVFSSEPGAGELISLARSSLLPYALGELPILELSLEELLEHTDSAIPKECIEYLAMSSLASLRRAEGIVTSKRVDPSETIQVKMLKEFVGIVDIPIFYPLIGFDEVYLRHLAEKIGGRELSVKIEKKGSQRAPRVEDQTGATCMPGSITKQYQEKIREAVLAALERAQART